MATAPGGRTRPWLARLGSVRIRSALAAAAVVTAAVGLVALGLVLTARSNLTRNIDDSARQRSGQVVAAIREGDPIRLEQTLLTSPGDQTLVQVVNPDGRVVAASAAISGLAPITGVRPAPGASTWEQKHLPLAVEDPFRVLTTTVATDDGTRVVIVAQSLRPVNESIEAITHSTILAMPVLAAVAALATFVFVGRSLRPVEAIRRRVATITGRDLDTRVPVPAAHDEIAALAETMNEMLDRLQTAADAQRRFVADASHELRSPLTTLRVGLDVLAAAAPSPQPQLARLQSEADRLGRLIADLLLLARIDEHSVQLADEEIDLDDLAYAQRDRIRADRPDLTVVANVAPARVRGDLRHLDRAVRNLVDNAARHAKDRVTLTLRSEPDRVELVVADDGDGIPPADRQRVFDRFVRLDDSRTRADGGAGLGLAISRDIVRAHGGTLTIVDNAGPGARLAIRLPLRRPGGSTP